MGEQNTIKVQPTNQTARLYTQKVVDDLVNRNNELVKALEAVKLILNEKCGIVSNAEAVGIINEVLNV